MALIKVRVKKSGVVNRVRFEAGMSVEIPCMDGYNPLTMDRGQMVQDAFMRIYGIDLRAAGLLNNAYLEVTKL